MEHMPELTLLQQQVLSLRGGGLPLLAAASMVEGEMDNAGGWGSFVTCHIRIKNAEQI